MGRHAEIILIAATLLSLSAGGLVRAASPEAALGRRIAQRNCGGCHAIGAGRSPNPDSPPFRRLYRRYGRGGLDRLLTEGMLASPDRPDEVGPGVHPRMPQVTLSEDEVAALKAYLHSLEPTKSGDPAEKR